MYRLQGFIEDHRRRHVGNQLEQPSLLLREGGPPIECGARQFVDVERQADAHQVKKRKEDGDRYVHDSGADDLAVYLQHRPCTCDFRFLEQSSQVRYRNGCSRKSAQSVVRRPTCGSICNCRNQSCGLQLDRIFFLDMRAANPALSNVCV